MIKRSLAVGLILFGVGAAAASAAPVRIETNFALGLNLCRLEGRDVDTKFDIKAGFQGGAFFSFLFTDFFALQPGITFSQKGAIYKIKVDSGTLRSTLDFSYLEIPIVARLGYLKREESPFRIYLLGGASVGLKLGSKIKLDLVQEGIETPIDASELSGYKSSAFDGIVGAGFDFAVKGGRLYFEGRYSRSLATISSEGLDHRFRTLTFFAGYAF